MTDTAPHAQPGSKHDIKEKAHLMPHHKAIHEKPMSRVDAGGGTAKRNIVRRGGGPATRKEKPMKHFVDSTDTEEIDSALDERDPNFASPADPEFVSNVE